MKAWMPSIDTPEALIEAAVHGRLDHDQTLQLCRQSPELVTLALLAAARQLAQLKDQSNRSEQGAAVQAILISVYRTLRLRGHEPIKTITAALKTYLITGNLPPLPAPATANG